MNTFNSWYYLWSPTVAEWEREIPLLRAAVRASIQPLLVWLEASKQVYILASMSLNPEFAIILAGMLASFLIASTYLVPLVLPLSLAFKARLRRLNVLLLVFPSSMLLHLLGLKYAGWLLPFSSTAIVLSTMLLTLLLFSLPGRLKA